MKLFWQGVASRMQTFFLLKVSLLEVVLVCVAGIISVWIIIYFLFMQTTVDKKIGAERGQHLSEEVIDELELWLEERQNAYEHPPRVPAAVFTSPKTP